MPPAPLPRSITPGSTASWTPSARPPSWACRGTRSAEREEGNAMLEYRAHDPAGVVREILAGGPLPAPEFRRLAYERGIPVKLIAKAARAAGAECRRTGAPGAGGWVWTLSAPEDDGIVT